MVRPTSFVFRRSFRQRSAAFTVLEIIIVLIIIFLLLVLAAGALYHTLHEKETQEEYRRYNSPAPIPPAKKLNVPFATPAPSPVPALRGAEPSSIVPPDPNTSPTPVAPPSPAPAPEPSPGQGQ